MNNIIEKIKELGINILPEQEDLLKEIIDGYLKQAAETEYSEEPVVSEDDTGNAEAGNESAGNESAGKEEQDSIVDMPGSNVSAIGPDGPDLDGDIGKNDVFTGTKSVRLRSSVKPKPSLWEAIHKKFF